MLHNYLICYFTPTCENYHNLYIIACKQAVLFGRGKRAAKPRGAGPSLARSREARFACPNRRACSQAMYITNLATVALKLDRAIRLSMEAPQGTQWVTFSNSSYDFRTNCTPLSPIIFFNRKKIFCGEQG